MIRILAYAWFHLVSVVTTVFGDTTPVLRVRGWLVRWCFRSCGRNFQVAGGVRVLFPTRIDVGSDVYIASGCWIQGVGGVTLGDAVMLGPYTILATNNHTLKDGAYRFGPGRTAPIVLKRGSWTGGHAVILPGVTIGAGVAVGAGSVVTADVPDGAVAAGVPARIIRESNEAGESGGRVAGVQ